MTTLNISFFAILKRQFKIINTKYGVKIKELQYVFYYNMGFILIIFVCIFITIYIVRKDIINFSRRIILIISNIIDKKYDFEFNTNEESILSKVENQLKHLIDIIKERENKNEIEKNNIKALISDISHQIKTPIANITMYNDTLIDRDISEKDRKIFLYNMKSQIVKLQWLIDALIKISRLENGVIKLNIKKYNISETIANVLSSVYIKAESKNIEIRVDCNKNIEAFYDLKWTNEAIFNILDNAVKYTDKNGSINIKVYSWDIFVKIDIVDSGIGISEKEIPNIFKRFYRVPSLSEIEGVGIGLYLSRKIISMENGYIKVESKKGKGSKFSIFLPKIND